MRFSRLLVAAMVCVAGPAFAQALTAQDLKAELDRRDKVIAALEQRVVALEANKDPAVAVPASPAPSFAATSSKPKDEEASLEALSRGLVARGALVLPRGAIEVAPELGYSHTQIQGLVLVDTPEGVSTVSDQRQRDDSIEPALTARVGLPWRSQLQVRVPFSWRRERNDLGDGTEVVNRGGGLGDVEIELSHQFLTEGRLKPALVGAFGWHFPTGKDPFQANVASVVSGSGVNQATARITALKSIDPLVLFTTLAYSASLGRDESFGRIRPGDTFSWQFGGLLAVSPDTSLSFGFSQQFKDRTTIDGSLLRGSDGVAAVAQVGLDQAINSRTLLDLSVGIGVTRDAPDYRVSISLPIRL